MSVDIHVKYLSCSFHFNKTQILRKSVQWETVFFFMQMEEKTDGQAERCEQTNRLFFFRFANAPKYYSIAQ